MDFDKKFCPFRDNWCNKEKCAIWDCQEAQCSVLSIGIGSMKHIKEKEKN